MSMYAVIGMTPQQRQRDCDVALLGDLYSSREEEARRELARHIKLVEDAAHDVDPRARLYERMGDLEVAILDVEHCTQASINALAMT